MAIPSVVLDALNSLKIASLPPNVRPGGRVDLGLSPGQNVFDVLTNPPTLFDIKLNDINLDNVGINLTDISLTPVSPQSGLQLTLDADNPAGPPLGTTDLQVVSKAVEFGPLSPPTGATAANINTSDASLQALPYLVPGATGPIAGTAVEGLLTRVRGTVKQVESLTGGITGNVIDNIAGHIKGTLTGTIMNLKGSVTAPKLLQSPPEVKVKWSFEDENGTPLIENDDFKMDGTAVTDAAAAVRFLPVFAELSLKGQLFATRRVSCTVTVKVGSDETYRLLGPIDILMPRTQLPTVLIMTEHAITNDADPGAVLIAVPAESLVTKEQLVGQLGDAITRLDELKDFIQMTDMIGQIGRIIKFISPPKPTTFLKVDRHKNLAEVQREPPFLIFGGSSWEDCISGLIMIGPPGRTARFHVARELYERLGAFEIVLGVKGVGYIENLTGSNPECKPAAPADPGGCTFTQRWNPPPSTFNDRFSSFQFLPLP